MLGTVSVAEQTDVSCDSAFILLTEAAGWNLPLVRCCPRDRGRGDQPAWAENARCCWASHPPFPHRIFRLGGGGGLHAPGFVGKPNPVLEETQSHMPEPRARPGYPSPNLRRQQESRRPWAAPQVASPPSSPGGPVSGPTRQVLSLLQPQRRDPQKLDPQAEPGQPLVSGDAG